LLRKCRNKPEDQETDECCKVLLIHGGYSISFLSIAPSAVVPRSVR